MRQGIPQIFPTASEIRELLARRLARTDSSVTHARGSDSTGGSSRPEAERKGASREVVA